jgi:hypothetical protein
LRNDYGFEDLQNNDNDLENFENDNEDIEELQNGDNDFENLRNDNEELQNGDNDLENFENDNEDIEELQNGDNDLENFENDNEDIEELQNGDNDFENLRNDNDDIEELQNGDNDFENLRNDNDDIEELQTGDNDLERLRNDNDDIEELQNGDNDLENLRNDNDPNCISEELFKDLDTDPECEDYEFSESENGEYNLGHVEVFEVASDIYEFNDEVDGELSYESDLALDMKNDEIFPHHQLSQQHSVKNNEIFNHDHIFTFDESETTHCNMFINQENVSINDYDYEQYDLSEDFDDNHIITNDTLLDVDAELHALKSVDDLKEGILFFMIKNLYVRGFECDFLFHRVGFKL